MLKRRIITIPLEELVPYFENAEEILKLIHDPATPKHEVMSKIFMDIAAIQAFILEGHPQDKDFLDEVVRSIVAHNTARGSKIKEAKSPDNIFWMLAQADLTGRLLPLARKLKTITGKDDFFRQVAEGIVPKVK